MMNKTKKNKVKLFFEKQDSSDTCRLHAINNALGRSAISREKFFKYCDQFDQQCHSRGSREFFFIHSDDNIFNFILNKFHLKSSYCPPDTPRQFSEGKCDNILAVMIFNEGHIWCVKQYDETWFIFDSLAKEPKAMSFRKIFRRADTGWIIIWKDPTLEPKEEALPTHPKIHTSPIKQPSVSISKRASRRRRRGSDILLDELSCASELNDSERLNRFEILSSIEHPSE